MEENKHYDYIIIGGGLTGLITALALKTGNPDTRIAILEKNTTAGGFARSSVIGGIDVDSIYMFPDIRQFFEKIGIDIEIYKYKNAFYNIKLIDDNEEFEIILPPDKTGFTDTLISKFPEEKHNIKRFVKFCYDVEDQFHNLRSKFLLTTLFKFIISSPALVFNTGLTVTGLIEKFGFSDKRLIRIFESFAGLGQLPPQKLNALIPLIAIVNLTKSTYRTEMTFGNVLKKITGKINDADIDLLYNKKAINVDKTGGIFFIKTADGSVYKSSKVISTVDTKKMFLEIISPDLIPAGFRKKIERLEMTLSAFVMKFIVRSETKYETDTGQILFYGGHDTFRILYERARAGKDMLDEKTFHFALTVKPDLSQPGLNSFELLSVPVSYEYWNSLYSNDRKSYSHEISRWEEFFLGKLDKHFEKNIARKIVSKQVLTPLYFGKKYDLTSGALYDMAQTGKQSGMNRQGFVTPVKDLYHCKMVHGIYGSVFQSFLLADFLLDGKLNSYGYRWD